MLYLDVTPYLFKRTRPVQIHRHQASVSEVEIAQRRALPMPVNRPPKPQIVVKFQTLLQLVQVEIARKVLPLPDQRIFILSYFISF